MAINIHELPAAGALTGAELVEVMQDGVNVQTTAQDIADLAAGGGGGTTVSAQTADFDADGASGTVYTNEGAAGTVVCTLGDSVVGTTYTIYSVENSDFGFATSPGINIVFYDPGTSATQTVDTDSYYSLLLLGGIGRLATVIKVNSATWAVSANIGASYYEA